jgi:H+/Cl- antiporter ClcA/CBS domain-containing protein
MFKRRSNTSPAPLGDFTTDPRVLLLVVMALAVGAGGAIAAWALLDLIGLFTNLAWFGRLSMVNVGLAGVAPSIWVVAIPVAGGLAIGLMARFGSEAIRGHGIPEAIEAILIGESRVQVKVAILKPLSSAISIGTGGPFGAEGPIIMTGGAIGSLFAQCFSLSAAERKTLLVAGAAAGMTAVFGTPVAAILLAVELLLFEWKPRSLIPVIAAVIVAASLRPFLIGSGPLFPIAEVAPLPWWGIFACVAMGVVSGLQSALMTRLLYGIEDLFERLPIHWMWWPAIGGLVVGLGGLIDPAAMGVGYDQIRQLVQGHPTASAVLLLVAVKSVIWLVSLSSGTSGGVLAPLLIMGGCVGWLVGQELPNGPAFWALLGMAAMMGGTMRAPLTAVMFALELSGAYDMLLPLIAAAGAAYAVTVLILKRSILTEKIARRGRHLTREYSTDAFEVVRAGEVMVRNVETLPAAMTVDDAVAFFTADAPRHKSYPIVDEAGRLVGLASRADVLRWRAQGPHGAATLYDMASDEETVAAHPNDTLARVVDIMVMRELGRVPIVEGDDRRLVGLIARKDLLQLQRMRMHQETQRSSGFNRARTGSQLRPS